MLQERNAELRAPGYFLMGNKPNYSLFWKTLLLSSKAVYTNIPDMIVENKEQSLNASAHQMCETETLINYYIPNGIFSGHFQWTNTMN